MAQAQNKFGVYLEIGQKRTFAAALDWPGWCRSGRDEETALQALYEYGPRYARILRTKRLGFAAPRKESAFVVRERLTGNTTTDFGAPDIAPANDARPVDSDELQHFEKILNACWMAFDRTIEAAFGKELRTGPRGGGRQLGGIIEHVLGSDAGYISQVGWKFRQEETSNRTDQLELSRQSILQALRASARGEIPAKGPRGGLRWSPRYFVRRVAWHTLDHVWEIEDRILPT